MVTRAFIGRDDELALFRRVLLRVARRPQLVYVHGPGGIGKTTLLHAVARMCKAPRVAIYLDARHIDPLNDSLLGALRRALDRSRKNAVGRQAETEASGTSMRSGTVKRRAGSKKLFDGVCRPVLLLDSFEKTASLEGWLRESLLPELPAGAVVVIASRKPPSTAWRTDPAWADIRSAIGLRNFSPEQSGRFLSQRRVPRTQHDVVVDFTHGHPLALALVCEVLAQRPEVPFRPEQAPDVVCVLLESLVEHVPDALHRAALEACAIARNTTEPLLATMLAIDDASALFAWLRNLPFIESGPAGLFPHDIVREVVVHDLRWRNQERFATFAERAHHFYVGRLIERNPHDRVFDFGDWFFLSRFFSSSLAIFQWRDEQKLRTERAGVEDLPALVGIVSQHEGPSSARLLQHWFSRQREAVTVVRDASNQVVGFIAMFSLRKATPRDIALDPAATTAHDYLQRCAPLRAGEDAVLMRFLMARDDYQTPSTVMGVLSAIHNVHAMTTPDLAFTFTWIANPAWEPFLPAFGYQHLPGADFELDGLHYPAFGHDWRCIPPRAWMTANAKVGLSGNAEPARMPEPLVVLSKAEFTNCVRTALRGLPDPHALRNNPLLRSRLVLDRTGPDAEPSARVATLQALIRDTIDALAGTSRGRRQHRALMRTYVDPAESQEEAAESLRLPFRTYRDHLTQGVAEVVERLWAREIGDAVDHLP